VVGKNGRIFLVNQPWVSEKKTWYIYYQPWVDEKEQTGHAQEEEQNHRGFDGFPAIR
jgi:hypothetical protein